MFIDILIGNTKECNVILGECEQPLSPETQAYSRSEKDASEGSEMSQSW